MTAYYVIIFVVYFFLALAIQYNGRNRIKLRNQDFFLFVVCVLLVLWAGFRDVDVWPDTIAYTNFFTEDIIVCF